MARLLRIAGPALALLFALAGCREASEGDSPAASSAAPASIERDPRPSIVLVVIESLRTDVVGAYGPDAASPFARDAAPVTPTLDRLAARGLRYDWAIASSPETVASHASLFTGLSPEQHGVGLWAQPTLPASLQTIAETLTAAGYETAAFSENPMVGHDHGLDQGFETFEATDAREAAAHLARRESPSSGFGIVERVRRWHDRRDPGRPFLLYVNLFDPHLPLVGEAGDPNLPPGVSATRLENVLASDPRSRICRDLPDPETLAILRGLYRSAAARADRKLGALLAITDAPGATPPITVVTADHGTHLGEESLLGHAFAVDNRAIRVPLVIAGATPDPGLVAIPVAQRRLAASIRCWSGESDACTEALPLEEPARPETIVSIFGDDRARLPASAVVDTGSLSGATSHARALCDREDGPFGRAIAWLEPPLKLIWRDGATSRLYDLSWDPGERSDQRARRPDRAAELEAEVEAFVRTHGLDRVRRRAETGSLAEHAERAFAAAKAALLAGGRTQTDAVWFVQLVLAERDDPELARWVEAQIPLHEDDPYFPIIAPDRRGPVDLPEDPGSGLMRWGMSLLAAVAEPEPLARRLLDEYLAMEDTSGYILTHQLSALEWARARGRAVGPATERRKQVLLARIAEEHANDPVFSDLWVERAAFLTAFGRPDPAEIERWTEVLVENHLGDGDWGDGATLIRFDGQAKVADHLREHARGMAMIVLARYLGASAR